MTLSPIFYLAIVLSFFCVEFKADINGGPELLYLGVTI